MGSSPSFLSSLSNPYSSAVYNGDPTTKKGLSNDLNYSLNLNSQQQSQQQGQRNSESSTLFPQYQDMLSSGYSPSEKAAQVGGALTPIASSYASAKGQAENRLARTGNSAGYGSFLGSLARGQGQDEASASQGTQKGFADEQERRREAGLQGIAGLYGIDTSFLSSLNGQQNSTLGLANSVESRRKGKIGDLAAGVGLAGDVLGLGRNIGSAITGSQQSY